MASAIHVNTQLTAYGICHILMVIDNWEARWNMISRQLRAAIKAMDDTMYRLAKDAEVDWGTLQRFVDGRRPNIRIDTVDKLCQALGLELQRKRKRSR